MKKILLIFFILNTVIIAKEEKNTEIFISPNIKLSQIELNKDKKELEEIGNKFKDFLEKFRTQLLDYYFENGKDMEKKVLKNIDKEINFNYIVDYSSYLSKQLLNYSLSKINLENIEIITNDTAKIKISESVPNINIQAEEDFYENTIEAFNQELKKDASLSNKNSIKNIEEYLKKIYNMKPKNYTKINISDLKLRKINGNWEITEINGTNVFDENFLVKDLFELPSEEIKKILFSDSENLQMLNLILGIDIHSAEITEDIVLYKRNSKLSISKNEIKDITREFKGTNYFPYKIKLLNNDTLTLNAALIKQNENKKKELQIIDITYKKENGKWKTKKEQ